MSKTCINLFYLVPFHGDTDVQFSNKSKTDPTATQKKGSPFLCPPQKRIHPDPTLPRTPTFGGFAEWNGRKEVYKGVVLGADAKD